MNKKLFLKNKSKTILMSIALSTFLVACGSSNKDSNQTNTEKPSEKSSEKPSEKKQEDSVKPVQVKTLTGKIVDGYLDGAKVCIDLNTNSTCDKNEPIELSDDKGSYTLNIKDIKDIHKYYVIAYGGIDIDTGKKFTGILKSFAVNDKIVNLSPLTTLLSASIVLSDDKETIKKDLEIKKAFLAKSFKLDINDLVKDPLSLEDNKVYKKAFALQKVVEILSSIPGVKQSNIYTKLAKNIDGISDIDNLVSISIDDNNKAKKAALKIISNVSKLKDKSSLKERKNLAKIIDNQIIQAIEHFQTSNDELEIDDISANFEQEAVKITLIKLGLEEQFIDSVSAALISNNIDEEDYLNLEIIKDIKELSPLVDLSKKDSNISDKLVLFKAVYTNNDKHNTLEIYFSHKFNQDTINKLESISSKDELNKFYKLSGLNFEIKSSSYDSKLFRHTLEFNESSAVRLEKKVLLKKLAFADTDNKYNKENLKSLDISSFKPIPKTGQEFVWEKYDDASYSDIGADLKYEKIDNTLRSTVSNLQWEDIPFTSGINTKISFSQVKSYCSSLSSLDFNNWRVPNVKELMTIANISHKTNPIFNNPVPIDNPIISITKGNSDRFGGTYGVVVSPNGGAGDSALNSDYDKNYSIKCVRDIDSKIKVYPNTSETNLFPLKGEDVSFDPSTKLMFQDEEFSEKENDTYSNEEEGKGNYGKVGTLDYAVQSCQDLTKAGYDDWRLPNTNELFYSTSIDSLLSFNNMPWGGLLTSTSAVSLEVRKPWVIGNGYSRGSKYYYDRFKSGKFFCVRSMDEESSKDIIPKDKENEFISTIVKNFYVDENNVVDFNIKRKSFGRYSYFYIYNKENTTPNKSGSYQIITGDENANDYYIVSAKKVGENKELKDLEGYFISNGNQGIQQNGPDTMQENDKYTLIIFNGTRYIKVNLSFTEELTTKEEKVKTQHEKFEYIPDASNINKTPKFMINETNYSGERILKKLSIIEKSSNETLVGKIILAEGFSDDIVFFIGNKEGIKSEVFYINKKGEILIKDNTTLIFDDTKSYQPPMKFYVYATNSYGSNKEYTYTKTSNYADDEIIEHKNGIKLEIDLLNLPEVAPTLINLDEKVQVFTSNTSYLFKLKDIVQDKGDSKISKFDIISGNNDSIFKIENGYYGYILLFDKTETSSGEYTLEIQATNDKGLSNKSTITIVINDVKAVSIKDSTYTIKGKGRYQEILKFTDNPNGVEIDIVDSLNGLEYSDLIFELTKESENYEIKKSGSSYTPFYGVFLKDGKTEVAETLEIKVTAIYNTKTLTSNIIKLTLTK
ncbi:MAG: hypothetical protein MJK08_05305 [Campylobacterales bacterium]|nr:hypothetical protein [Campylobacterales bacterium]